LNEIVYLIAVCFIEVKAFGVEVYTVGFEFKPVKNDLDLFMVCDDFVSLKRFDIDYFTG
jgi:hypothetical protein